MFLNCKLLWVQVWGGRQLRWCWHVVKCVDMLWSCCCHLGFIVYYLYCIGQYSHVFEWRNWSIAPKELYLSFLLQFNAITQLVLINFIVGSVCSGTNCFYPFFIWFPLCFFTWQGKWAEGIIHLERVASLKEPDDPKSKAHYFDGLVLLARYELEQFLELVHIILISLSRLISTLKCWTWEFALQCII